MSPTDFVRHSTVTIEAKVTEAPGAAPIADGLERPLDPRVIPYQKTVGRIVTACLAGASLIALIVFGLAGDLSRQAWPGLVFLWAMAVGALAWGGERWPAIEYRFVSYRVDEAAIEIRRGVYWRKVINVPRSRIQHTDVSQGPLERAYGLGTLVIYTAGTDHAKVDLAGLDHATALRIREHLLPRDASDVV
jgi:membrane protein YdbS with pleckstrin-like domain